MALLKDYTTLEARRDFLASLRWNGGAGIKSVMSNIASIGNPGIWRAFSIFYLIKRVVQ
jgi:hypothetical protein